MGGAMTGKSSKTSIAVVGGTGYTGLTLLSILLKHPQVTIEHIISEQYAGQALSKVYPAFQGILDLVCEGLDLLNSSDLRRLEQVDLVFFATPNGLAHKVAPRLIEAGVGVIDLSADYRFGDLAVYEQWYGIKRKDKEDISANKNAIYGLVEFKRERIKTAAKKSKNVLIGNPGCYPTASALALTPLLEFSAKQKGNSLNCDFKSIIVDAKSGISGAGRKAEVDNLFSELNESISPYKLANQHRHTPELEMFLSEQLDHKMELSFSPHLIPMTRGMLVTCYVNIENIRNIDEKFIRKIYEDRYKDETFVELLPPGVYPKTKWVTGTNRALLQVNYDERLHRVIITCVIDNLIKGASGQAVQNMNLIFGFPEDMGLNLSAQVP